MKFITNADLIIADPPYGKNYQSNHRLRKFKTIHGDSKYSTEWLPIATKLIDRGSIYLFCDENSISTARALLHSNKWSNNRMLVWDKQNNAGGDLKNYGLRTEYILYGTKMFSPKLNGSRDGNLISIPRVRPQALLHPNEKPYLLTSYLVMKSTNPDEIVLDPFMGSGIIALSSRDLGRRYIGIEIEENFCEIAARRLAQEMLPFGSNKRLNSTAEKRGELA